MIVRVSVVLKETLVVHSHDNVSKHSKPKSYELKRNGRLQMNTQCSFYVHLRLPLRHSLYSFK